LVAGDVALLVRNDDPIGSVMLRCAPWGAPPATMASPLRGGDGDRMELRASTSPFQTTHTPSPSRGVFRPSFALLITPSPNKGRREGRVPAGTHGPLCACSAKELHSGIQVKPNTRPSLRSGLTAYAALSPETNSCLPPSPRELTMRLARSGSPHLRKA
jgi:hypothetical protein